MSKELHGNGSLKEILEEMNNNNNKTTFLDCPMIKRNEFFQDCNTPLNLHPILRLEMVSISMKKRELHQL